MNTVSFETLKKLKNPIIVDIRDNYSYNISHIKNSINIPYYNLLNNYSYYLYCDEGIQSYEISTRLNLFGYNTKSLEGGFKSIK